MGNIFPACWSFCWFNLGKNCTLKNKLQVYYPEQFIDKRDKKILQYFKYRKIIESMYTSKIVIQFLTQNCNFNCMLQFEYKCCFNC